MRSVKYQTMRGTKRGNYSPSVFVEVTHDRRKVALETMAGSPRDVSVFKSGNQFYVLTRNEAQDFVGLQQFNMNWIESHGESIDTDLDVEAYDTDLDIAFDDWRVEDALGGGGKTSPNFSS
jgi:hypothetical protein